MGDSERSSDSDDRPAPEKGAPEKSGKHTHEVVSSQELLGGRSELLIEHQDELYRLRITRAGKLILHK